MPFLTLAVIAAPGLAACLRFAGPVVGIWFLVWVCRNADAIVRRLFPHLEWERQLGWLNIRSERRANAVMRALGHSVHALLAVTLLGIVWSAHLAAELARNSAFTGLGVVFIALPLFIVCFAPWLYYLGAQLLPRLRAEFELEELVRFRTEQAAGIPDEDMADRLATPAPLLPARGPARKR